MHLSSKKASIKAQVSKLEAIIKILLAKLIIKIVFILTIVIDIKVVKTITNFTKISNNCKYNGLNFNNDNI